MLEQDQHGQGLRVVEFRLRARFRGIVRTIASSLCGLARRNSGKLFAADFLPVPMADVIAEGWLCRSRWERFELAPLLQTGRGAEILR